MTTRTLNSTLDQLEKLKRSFDRGTISTIDKALSHLSRQEFNDPDALTRYHELLLFLRAYPYNSRIVTLAEKELASFPRRVKGLRAIDSDLSSLETPEISGIAGTSVTDTFSYPIVRWLARHQPGRLALDWDWFEDENRLAATWPRFMPMLEDDAAVEADVPYRKWLSAAGGREEELPWLIRRFESLPKTEKEKIELYDSQKLYVRWTPPYPSTRTGMRLQYPKPVTRLGAPPTVPKIFYHREPLIPRRDVSLRDELEKPSPTMQLLSTQQGEAILNLARAASTVRYRELYGFTHGEPRRVFRIELGRGAELFVIGLPPNWRLPLRAYHAAMIFKNRVPIGYFEGLSLFERMESGFNLYYTFRDGETAWLYARTLNVFRHLLGVSAFTLDPYQIGYENEEGIESGAFWFYRKLGFRSTNPEVMKLVVNEERKMTARPGYRTSASTLRKLAQGSMIFELDKTRSGDWDRFQVRNIGLAAARHMAAKFNGDADRMRAGSLKSISLLLEIRTDSWRAAELTALSHFAGMLPLIEDLASWSPEEKQALVRVIRGKAASDESTYLKLMQKNVRLRSAMIKLGSQ